MGSITGRDRTYPGPTWNDRIVGPAEKYVFLCLSFGVNHVFLFINVVQSKTFTVTDTKICTTYNYSLTKILYYNLNI